MKKVNIYFVANEKELLPDEKEISNFIRDLNDKYEDNDIYFQLITDENVQELKEEDIKNSELFFILFCKEIEENTIQKFNIAYENFKNCQNPKISTYVKKSNEPAGKTVITFMQKLDEELGHYYNIYENIDTIKLNIVLRLKTLGLSLGNLESRDGKLYINEKEIMTLENIPMMFHNKKLQELKTEAKELEDNYWDLKERARISKENERIQQELEDVEYKRNQIKAAIYELEKNILDLQFSFVKISSEGNLSRRQVYAQKCLEQGDIEAAKEALKLEDIKQEAQQILELQNTTKEELQIKINELMQRVETLKIDQNNENRFQEIEDTFAEAIRIEKEGGLYRASLLQYAIYLENNRQYAKAIEMGKKFLAYLQSEEIENNLEDAYMTYGVLANSYSKTENLEDAENNLLQKIEIAKKMENEEKLADTYQEIVTEVYEKTEEYGKAEEYYQKIIEIYEKHSQLEMKLAKTYKKLGVMYCDIEQEKKAEIVFLKAISILEKHLEQKDDEEGLKQLEYLYYSMVFIYLHQHQYLKAEEYNLKQMALIEELQKREPKKYKARAKECYDNLAKVYAIATRNVLFHKEARKLAKKLFSGDLPVTEVSRIGINSNLIATEEFIEKGKLPRAKRHLKVVEDLIQTLLDGIIDNQIEDAIETIIICASAYEEVANCYQKMQEYQKAEENYKNAIKAREAITNKTIYDEDAIFVTYYHLTRLYEITNQKEKIEQNYQKIVELLQKMVPQNPKAYQVELASTYNNLAVFYEKQEKLEEAEKYYLMAIELAEKDDNISKEDSLAFYENLALYYEKQKREPEATKCEEKYIQLQEQVLIEKPERKKHMLPNLAKECVNLGMKYRFQENYEKSLIYYNKTIAFREEFTNGDIEKQIEWQLDKIYHNVAIVLRKMKRYEEAENYFLKSIYIKENGTIKNEKEYKDGLENTYLSLAELYEEMEKKEQERIYLDKAEALKK